MGLIFILLIISFSFCLWIAATIFDGSDEYDDRYFGVKDDDVDLDDILSRL